jgi:uncharacterized Zn-finger protein
MTEVRDNNIIVYCRGDDNNEGSGHPLIYLHKEGETFCPYCNKPMNEKFESVDECTIEAVNKKERTQG